MDTSPWVYPNDTATVEAASGQTDIDGTVEFKLYGPTGAVSAATNCGLNGATGLLYSQTVTLADAAETRRSVSTTNPGGGDAPNTSRKIEADAIVVWRVEYSGDSNHFGRLSSCDRDRRHRSDRRYRGR